MKKSFYVTIIFLVFLLQNTCFCKAYNLADIDKAMTASEYNSKTKVDDMDTVWFGDYYDTGENSYKLIEWVVLEKQNNKALLLSKNVLDCKNYNDDENDKNVTWENCSLRTWLNTAFIDKAFDEKKNNGKKMILDTNLETHGLSENKTEDNVSYTTDKIFVLSDDEITKYLDKESRISKATIYAKNVDNNGKKLYVIQHGKEFEAAYWLRDVGKQLAKNITPTGGIFHRGVNNNSTGVRPALWVDLSTKNDYKNLTVPPKDETSKNQIAKQLKSIKSLNEYKNIETVENIKTVTFGNYMQTNETGNNKDPIDWIVLDKKDDKVLLLSKYILDNKQYHFESVDITWENCELRKWLNNSFYNEAFSKDEKKQIMNVNIENNDNVKFDTIGGSNTADKIFVLSEDDIKQYFRKYANVSKFSVLSTKATHYARNQKNITGYGLLVDDNSNSYYYLRTPGKFQNHAMIALTDNSFEREGVVVSNYCGIRPAMWVSLADINNNNNVDDANKDNAEKDNAEKDTISDEQNEETINDVKEMSVEECGDINRVLFEMWYSINMKTNLDCYFPDLWSNKNTYAHLSYRKKWLEDSDVRCKFDKNNNLWVIFYADGNEHINDNLILEIYFTDGRMEEYYHEWDSNGMFSTKSWSFGNSEEIKNSEFDAKIEEFENMQDQMHISAPMVPK